MCRATNTISTFGKTLFVLLLAFVCILPASAQKPPKFDPARFEADLEQFITTEAGLMPAEAAKFFPLYREMRSKQKAFFANEKRMGLFDQRDEKMCEEVILQHDNNDIEIKKIQKNYHLRFLEILPATKVFKIIQAEDKFHRELFKRVAKHDRKRKHAL